MNALARQMNLHPAISGNAVSFMIYGLNLMQDILFSDNFFCPSVLSVVIISIWINFQTSQQPPNTKQIPIFVYEPIGLQSIPFAKNAAAFFRKRFSFFASASSSRKRRFSFMSSRSFWAVGFFEALFCHSSLNSLHHLQMLAFETPYSAVRLRYVRPSSIWRRTICCLNSGS